MWTISTWNFGRAFLVLAEMSSLSTSSPTVPAAGLSPTEPSHDRLPQVGTDSGRRDDRLWFRANSSGVTNGTLASLAGTDEQGRLVTTDGFVVPEDYLKIAHGYATTSHLSQGLTANFAVVFGASFDQKAIYVSHSRARERVDTYIPSKEAFLSRAERAQGERLGVLEAMADAKRKMTVPMVSKLAIASPGTTRLEVDTDMSRLYPAW